MGFYEPLKKLTSRIQVFFFETIPAGIEPALPERQSGVLTAILWNPLCMRTGGTGPQDCFYICLLTVLNLYCIYSDNLIYRYVEHGS